MRVAAPFVVVGLARIASAEPIAHLDQDVDGDGVADRVELDATGTLRIQSKTSPATLQLGSVGHASLEAATVRGTPVLVVHLATNAGDEVAVFEHAPAWKQVLRQPVGKVGLDGDFAMAIDAAPNGIYRYQVRAGYRRCDGKPAYLFAEGWTGTKFQRLSKIPTNVPDNAPVITARADATVPAAPLLYQARIASHEPGAGDAGGLAIPTELDDGKPATFWHEDFAASDGEGQFFTFEPRFAGAKATQLRIVPGNPTSAATQRSFDRPHRLGVVTAKNAWHVDLPDVANEALGAAYIADLPAAIEGCVTVVIESTYGGDKGTTAIAELEVFAEGERAGGGEVALAHVVAEGKDNTKAATQALARRGAAGATALDAELAKASDPSARTRLVRALIEVHDPAAGTMLAHAIAQGWARDRELVDAITALGSLGQAQELHDLAAKHELELDARIAAVHALGDKGGALLIDLAGDGPRELRRAVIEVLTGVPIDTLIHATQGDLAPAAHGDLWRAITRRAHANPADREPALRAMTAALASTTDYERRYRLIDGVAAIGDAAALQTLDALLRGLPPSPERAAFEQVAARAIAVNPRPEALGLIVELARDPDPGVRLAALAALSGADAGVGGPWHAPEGPDAIDRVILTSLSTDTWPELRRRAAQVLGGRCSRPGPAHALADAIGRDPDLGVRGDALAALVECKASGAADLLAHVWDDSKLPLELRQRAVDLSVNLGDRALGAKLVGKLGSWRGAALESADALALAQNAAYALGRLAPPGAADALLGALDETAFPEIVAAAASGLGLLGPACPAVAKGKLKLLAHSDEQQIQVAAAHAAAQCGK